MRRSSEEKQKKEKDKGETCDFGQGGKCCDEQG